MLRSSRRILGWLAHGRRPLAAALVASAALRVFGLERPSHWYDEVVPMRLALERGPVALLRLLPRIEGTWAPRHPLPRAAPPQIDLNEVTLRDSLGPRADVRKVYVDSTAVPEGPSRGALWLVDRGDDRRPIHAAIARTYEVAALKRLGVLRVTYYRRRPIESARSGALR